MSEPILCAYCSSQKMKKTSTRGIFKCEECACLTDRTDQTSDMISNIIGKAIGTIVLGGIGALIFPEVHDNISDHISGHIDNMISGSIDDLSDNS
jgi:hypothetical protein